jgi:ribosomal protein L11 methyltransferase
MNLHEIKVEIPPDRADEADNAMLELGLEGWSLLEDAIAKRAWVVGIFGSESEARARWSELSVVLPGLAMGEPVERGLVDGDWRDSYKAHFKAWRFGRLHWVPVWERENFKLPLGEEVLWLDPGMAFGTGNHETTRLCVERLTELDARQSAGGKRRARRRVVDAGCGSGILALSAAKLGFEDVVGFDNDPEAVKVSGENAALNGLGRQVGFYVGDLVSGLAGRSVDILLANILANVLIQFAAQLVAAVAPGGTLVLSGILAVESGQVRAAFRAVAPGWKVDTRVLGEWSDVVLTRPG